MIIQVFIFNIIFGNILLFDFLEIDIIQFFFEIVGVDVYGNDELCDVIIVGFGLVGYIVVVYIVCVGLKLLVFEGLMDVGGVFMQIIEVENYLGFFEGIMGFDFMVQMCVQVEWFGVEFIVDDVIDIDFIGEIKKFVDIDGNIYKVYVVIFVMGLVYCKFGFEDELWLFGCGVLWCVICDGFFFIGKDIVVVGGGDFVVEEVIFFIWFVNLVIFVYCCD